MKKIFLGIFATLALNGLTAQTSQPSRSSIPGNSRYLSANPMVQVDTALPRNKAGRTPMLAQLNGRYSHGTEKGAVYLMSPDNMPCLVPNARMNAPMPNAKRFFVPGMKSDTTLRRSPNR